MYIPSKSYTNVQMTSLYPRFEKVWGILVYICPWFRPWFRPSFRNSVTLFRQSFKIATSYLVYRFTTTSCIVGLQMGILLFVLPVSVPFSFFPDFSSKISPQPLKIETSNLVYRLTMTCCIAGLKMGLFLFVLPCICSFFFSYHIFVKDISTTVQDRNFKFGIQVHNNRLYRGIENGPSPICSSVLFLSVQIFRQRYLHNRFR